MIEYRKGNLLDVTSGVIAHGVNCQGVMGSGVAKAIKDKYPKAFEEYYFHCRDHAKSMKNTFGLLCTVQMVPVKEGLTIANCFTQDRYGTDMRHVDYEAIARCFSALNNWTESQLNIPKIGAGLGGGDWNVIESIINSEYKADVIVWEL